MFLILKSKLSLSVAVLIIPFFLSKLSADYMQVDFTLITVSLLYCRCPPTLLKLKTTKGADGISLRIIQTIAAHDYTTFGMCLLQDENGEEVELIKKNHIQDMVVLEVSHRLSSKNG